MLLSKEFFRRFGVCSEGRGIWCDELSMLIILVLLIFDKGLFTNLSL